MTCVTIAWSVLDASMSALPPRPGARDGMGGCLWSCPGVTDPPAFAVQPGRGTVLAGAVHPGAADKPPRPAGFVGVGEACPWHRGVLDRRRNRHAPVKPRRPADARGTGCLCDEPARTRRDDPSDSDGRMGGQAGGWTGGRADGLRVTRGRALTVAALIVRVGAPRELKFAARVPRASAALKSVAGVFDSVPHAFESVGRGFESVAAGPNPFAADGVGREHPPVPLTRVKRRWNRILR